MSHSKPTLRTGWILALGSFWLAGCTTVSLDSPGWPPLRGTGSPAPVVNQSTPQAPVAPSVPDAGVVVTPVQDIRVEPVSPVADQAPTPAPAEDISWVGHYAGSLPCTDCPGIRTLLSLYEDGSYILSMKRETVSALPVIQRGQTSWSAGRRMLQLDRDGEYRRYAYQAGQLQQLDADGSPMGDRYQLKLRQED